MNDRELLELAAKTAGYKWSDIEFFGEHGLQLVGAYTHKNWNPLTDDGDTLRLAVKLSITPVFDPRFSMVHADPVGRPLDAISVDYGDDPYAATRRAIVRAAAEIGKAMP